MDQKDIDLLKHNGWTVTDQESFTMIHENGTEATGFIGEMILKMFSNGIITSRPA